MSTEDDLLEALSKFLTSKKMRTRKSYRLNKIEIDVIASGKYDIVNDKNTNYDILYAFEAKLASTPKLVRDVIEQAVTRLLFVDYSIMVVPCVAEVWINDKEKKEINLAQVLEKRAKGWYSRYLGIICVNKDGVNLVRKPKKSTIVISEIRDKILKELSNTKLF
ncbi:glycosyltransferase family protein [Saccharolobus shibatae]|uniref:Element excision controlling factor, EndoMS-like nuclease n=1 Tax=Saccharolobus shibatae TaxID=2286 RepID=A0A8F5GUZ2_9CREN|nr:hypothetical protein [Saccharolobus shibatae]QXJ30333.1 Element excision controlling factor, EndoMS-like nuclease [Saccharolobus shibatae]QXJ30435.1 Element excision controlling factor, EndoMS-like nuclease [Saccharolobus shibatae]